MNPSIGMALCLALGLGLAGCKQTDQVSIVRPVLVERVQMTPAPRAHFAGTVEARYARPLAFRAAGKVIARDVRIGQSVKAGDRIAAIDATTLDQVVRSAEANSRAAEAGHARATADVARLALLVKQGATSQSSLDTATQAEAAAQATVKRAQAVLGKAREARGYAQIFAPSNGVISATPVQIGQTVTVGETVAVLSEPDLSDAVIDVPETLAKSLHRGEKFTVALQIAPDTRASGVLRAIAPQVDPATGTRRLWIALQHPPAGFILGTTVTVWRSQTGPARIAISPDAVFTKDGSAHVWLIGQGKARAQEVTLAPAPTADGLRVVTTGLHGGEQIAVAGAHSLKEGQHVRPITQERS